MSCILPGWADSFTGSSHFSLNQVSGPGFCVWCSVCLVSKVPSSVTHLDEVWSHMALPWPTQGQVFSTHGCYVRKRPEWRLWVSPRSSSDRPAIAQLRSGQRRNTRRRPWRGNTQRRSCNSRCRCPGKRSLLGLIDPVAAGGLRQSHTKRRVKLCLCCLSLEYPLGWTCPIVSNVNNDNPLGWSCPSDGSPVSPVWFPRWYTRQKSHDAGLRGPELGECSVRSPEQWTNPRLPRVSRLWDTTDGFVCHSWQPREGVKTSDLSRVFFFCASSAFPSGAGSKTACSTVGPWWFWTGAACASSALVTTGVVISRRGTLVLENMWVYRCSGLRTKRYTPEDQHGTWTHGSLEEDFPSGWTASPSMGQLPAALPFLSSFVTHQIDGWPYHWAMRTLTESRFPSPYARWGVPFGRFCSPRTGCLYSKEPKDQQVSWFLSWQHVGFDGPSMHACMSMHARFLTSPAWFLDPCAEFFGPAWWTSSLRPLCADFLGAGDALHKQGQSSRTTRPDWLGCRTGMWCGLSGRQWAHQTNLGDLIMEVFRLRECSASFWVCSLPFGRCKEGEDVAEKDTALLRCVQSCCCLNLRVPSLEKKLGPSDSQGERTNSSLPKVKLTSLTWVDLSGWRWRYPPNRSFGRSRISTILEENRIGRFMGCLRLDASRNSPTWVNPWTLFLGFLHTTGFYWLLLGRRRRHRRFLSWPKPSATGAAWWANHLVSRPCFVFPGGHRPHPIEPRPMRRPSTWTHIGYPGAFLSSGFELAKKRVYKKKKGTKKNNNNKVNLQV